MPQSTPQQIERLYLVLTLLTTLATSFIWGINTIFLLDAGLTNAQAFLTNAFFTVGQVIFEIPTGLVADLKGRRTSYLLGTLALALSTLMYLGAWYVQASIVVWAVSSILLGLGYTFFSGATEAWLVDALAYVKHKGTVDTVFGRGQMTAGAAMLVGSVAGGAIAQFSNIATPYIVRAVILLITFVVAFMYMRDLGFKPVKKTSLATDVSNMFHTSLKYGLQKPAIRWLMLAAPFTAGTGIYVFYAMQPHLLALYGDSEAYLVAGLAAALVAGAQIVGGMIVPQILKNCKKRTTVLLAAGGISVGLMIIAGITQSFWLTVVLLSLWGLTFAASMPVRQGYINGLIPTKQRATVLSFDALMGSGGGAVIQPVLGRVADMYSYSTSFITAGVITSAALPFYLLSRRERVSADNVRSTDAEAETQTANLVAEK